MTTLFTQEITPSPPSSTGSGEESAVSPKHSDSFVPLPRSWLDRLNSVSGNALKLLIFLLIEARFSGPQKGMVAVSFRELALELRIGRQSVVRAAHQLREQGVIDWVGGKNQYGVTVFRILEYPTAVAFAGRNRDTSSVPAEYQHDTGGSCKSNGQQAKAARNNEKNETNRKTNKKNSLIPSESQIFVAARDYAFEAFTRARGQRPTWGKKDYAQLAQLLRNNPEIGIGEFSQRWDRYLASRDSFFSRNGFSLACFCSYFDGFLENPISGQGGMRYGSVHEGGTFGGGSRLKTRLIPESHQMPIQQKQSAL